MFKSFKVELYFKGMVSLEVEVSAYTKQDAIEKAKHEAKLMGWNTPSTKVKCKELK